MKKLFGTDGVRGVANVYPMTTEMAMQIGRAAAHIFRNGKSRHRIVIGKDTRLSGYMIENALVAGICSMGVDVLQVGPLPTPGIANITSSMRADAGVVISASHNPFQDNGIKFFCRDGFKLPDEMELRIEELIFSGDMDSMRPIANEVGKAYRIDDAAGRFVVFLKSTFPKDMDLSGLKIVLDCANGAAYKVAPAVFEELGAEVIAIGVKPNGTNINAGCGSLHPEVISAAVKEHGADLGIALDGDADRVIFVDEFGNEVNGDNIMAICATDMLQKGTLNKQTLVATVMSNMGLDIAVKRAGGRVIKTAVGDRYVVEEMQKGGYNLGGEQSGHMIFLDHNTTGDGILSALQVLAVMQRQGKRLSELAEVMFALPQVLVNVRVAEKRDVMTIPAVAGLIGDIEAKVKDEGRILIRYSGTEPLLRIMLEGQDKYQISGWAKEIADLVEKNIGGSKVG
ncbi:phosphoglucosamine mutase [Geotalea daltonii FRC-32]|uniref:Phosphoglucosamine mutase n=1 Tax=Geotalea daltonii (strain DSM 22248 / JCM 15807 / FRC-32) TaxID=316067 RepID=GLMM_GEODF|nr:phosphoglucosamine mutase [Geotalea daltonii]B9M5K3.1 RecName: Full=Phosphoglucosamine mutase [Geotalea daltonii FRC-32]ACM21762.1 phosphoglucosamine mutase [Geotalea daltonii FRC-32]